MLLFATISFAYGDSYAATTGGRMVIGMVVLLEGVGRCSRWGAVTAPTSPLGLLPPYPIYLPNIPIFEPYLPTLYPYLQAYPPITSPSLYPYTISLAYPPSLYPNLYPSLHP
eukprot:596360-Rhodomonas_salina.1